MDIQINPCRDGWLQVGDPVAVPDPPGSILTVYVDPDRQQIVHHFTVPGEPDRAVFMDPAEQRNLRDRIRNLAGEGEKEGPTSPHLILLRIVAGKRTRWDP